MLGQAAPRLAGWPRLTRPQIDPNLVRHVVAALLAAALLETILLRLVTRIGVHLPRGAAVSGGIEVASFFGSLAFNFASILAIALVVFVLAALILRNESVIVRVLLAGLSAAMLWGLGFSLATGSPTADAVFGLTMALLVTLVGLVLVRQDGLSGRAKLALGLIVAAYLCYQYYMLTQVFFRVLDLRAVPPMSVPALRFGEGLVVLAGGAVFWAWGVDTWRRAGLAGVALVALLVAAVGLSSMASASTMSILALWTTGISLFLPLPLYLLSLGLYLVTMIACWRHGRDSFWTAGGLLLILLAGYMPEASYHHLLLLLGVACLSGAIRDAAAAESRAVVASA